MSESEVRRWVYFVTMILFWFATLGIFAHYSQNFGDAALGALIVSLIAGFCFYLIFVD